MRHIINSIWNLMKLSTFIFPLSTFVSCSQEEFLPQETDSDAVKITANIGKLQTRVSYHDNGATSFDNGDQIRVKNTLRTSKNIATYNLTDEGWNTADAFVWNGGTSKNQFEAWYPVGDYSSFSTFELPTDQSEGIETADWMTIGTNEMEKPSDKTLNLNFDHMLTKVTVKIAAWGSEYDGTAKSIENVKIYSLATDIVQNREKCEGEIKTASLTAIDPLANGNSYTAIVCPGLYTTDQKFMTFTVNGTDHLTVLAKATQLTTGLEAGKHYTFNLTVGKNAAVISSVSVIDWAQENIAGGVAEEVDYTYNESTNTYIVRTADALNTAISNAGTSGTAEKPAKIMLLNDIAVEAQENEQGLIEYAVLIETGNIIIDLNGCQLSATNDFLYTIQIGAKSGETSDAVVTIDDSSMDKSGKIVGLHTGISNNGGTLIINDGTIEVNSTAVNDAAIGIESYKGSITVNGGTINVTGVAEYSVTSGISEAGDGGTVTINGGSINVNSPVSHALYARSNWSIKGGTITSNGYHISGDGTVSLQTNDEGIGATFVDGIKSWNTLNSLLSEGVGYYGADGNLIEVADDVKEITDNGDIMVKKLAETE